MPKAVARAAYEVGPHEAGCAEHFLAAAVASAVAAPCHAARSATVKSPAGDIVSAIDDAGSSAHGHGTPGSATQPATVCTAGRPSSERAGVHVAVVVRVTSAVSNGRASSSTSDAWRTDWFAATASAGPMYRATTFSFPKSRIANTNRESSPVVGFVPFE